MAIHEMNPTVENLEAKVALLTRQLADERAAQITLVINNLVADRRLTPTEVPKALARALADATYLAELRMRTPLQAGACPQ